MAKHLLLLAILLFLPNPASANMYDIFVDMLSEKYTDNVSDLPPPPDIQPDANNTKTTMIVDNQGHPVLWLYSSINISGFYPSARIDNTDYVQNLNDTIVSSRTLYKFDRDWCKECYINNMTNETSVKILNNTVFAYLNITINWTSVHWVWCGDGCWYRIDAPHVSHQNISDNRTAPNLYPQMSNSTVYINIYNYTFEPKTTIRYEVDNATQITVSYDNSSLTHVLYRGHVEYTQNEIPFLNMSPVDTWAKQGDQVSHIGNVFLINGTADPRDIIVQASSPFETITLTNYNITQVEPSPPFNAVFLPFVLLISVIYLTTVKILRSIQI